MPARLRIVAADRAAPHSAAGPVTFLYRETTWRDTLTTMDQQRFMVQQQQCSHRSVIADSFADEPVALAAFKFENGVTLVIPNVDGIVADRDTHWVDQHVCTE